jgi:hypothetical protein
LALERVFLSARDWKRAKTASSPKATTVQRRDDAGGDDEIRRAAADSRKLTLQKLEREFEGVLDLMSAGPLRPQMRPPFLGAKQDAKRNCYTNIE